MWQADVLSQSYASPGTSKISMDLPQNDQREVGVVSIFVSSKWKWLADTCCLLANPRTKMYSIFARRITWYPRIYLYTVYVCILNVYIYIHMFILLYPIIPMGRRLFQKRIMQDPLSHSMSFMEETGSRSVMGLTKEAYTHVHGVRLCESSYCMKIVYIHMFNMYS